MKKSLVALAVLGALSGAAYADGNVTVYGILDAGIMSASKTGPTGNGGSVLAFQDAAILPSIYGLKGTEDLGGGLKASFTLEGGFDTGNGEHNSPGVLQTQTFGREAKVNLSGDWGTFGAGLQLDPAVAAAIATEPRGMTDSLSSLEYWIIATFHNAPAGTLSGGIFDANSISYAYAGNGFSLGLLYSFGGVAGSTSADSAYSIGASWAGSGVTVSAGYVEQKANVAATSTTSAYTGANSEIWFIGGGYASGPFAGRLQYQEFKYAYAPSTGTAGDDVKDVGLGVDYKAGANTLNLSYYHAKDDGAAYGGSTNEIALLDTYGLSKRTSVYGQIANVKTNTTSGGDATIGAIYTPVPGLGASLGVSTFYVGIGVQHVF